MRLLFVALVAMAACTPAPEPPITVGTVTLEVQLCLDVGARYCEAQAGCRPEHPIAECQVSWAYFRCGDTPEKLDDESALTCEDKWQAWGGECSTWWANNWWLSTAPTCSALPSLPS